MSTVVNIEGLTPELISEAVAWRQDLHRHPELAYAERRTAQFVASQLAQFGLQVHEGLAGTGVVGTLSRGTSRRTIAIRADMDALPIQEQGTPTYASCHAGVMHACGHDGHVAMALAAARVCADMADLDGTVHFIFQPAEENEGGARRMVSEGLFSQFPCEAVYALHNWPTLAVGACVARDAAMMAALALFEIRITGRGAHGAMPHEGVDPILAGCQIVSALQGIVSRNVDPLKAAVISVAQVRAGDTWNVIPDECIVRGTTRWFDSDIGDLLETRIGELCVAVARGFGCGAQVRYERRFPATINHASAARTLRAAAELAGLNVREAAPSMSSEDFSVMLERVPGCYAWLGTQRAGGSYGLHSSQFDFNDEALPFGVALWSTLVRRSLTIS